MLKEVICDISTMFCVDTGKGRVYNIRQTVLTLLHAKEWATHMNPPARWTMDQTTAVMRQQGYNHKPCKFYAVMNALASDYGKTMAKSEGT